MSAVGRAAVRRAVAQDAPALGRLLDDFNREFGEASPGADALAERLRELLASEHVIALVAEEPAGEPAGVAVLRFRPGLWTRKLESYLAELYVAPDHRGHGLGRALLEGAIEVARRHGADRMDLATSEADVAARGLYESLGFTNRERPPDGPVMYVYEREL